MNFVCSFHNHGLTYLRMSDEFENAERWLQKALVIEPDHPEIRFLLAKVYELTDREPLAINTLEKTLSKHPNNILTLYQLVQFYTHKQTPILITKAEEYLTKIVNSLPANLVAKLKLIELLIKNGKPSILGVITAAVAGLVAITPASGSVGPMGALAIGIASGIACYWGATCLKAKCGYDDSLDVFGVHGIGGIVGALLTGIFVAKGFGGTGLAEGVTMGGQLGKQAIGVLTTVVYSGVVSFIILKIVDATMGLRVSEEEETQGLDSSLHGEEGYNL